MDKPENPIFAARRRQLRRLAKDSETFALLTERSGDDAYGVPMIDAYLSGARPITDTEAELLETLLGMRAGSLSEGVDPLPTPLDIPAPEPKDPIHWAIIERLVEDPPRTVGAALFGVLIAIGNQRATALGERLLRQQISHRSAA